MVRYCRLSKRVKYTPTNTHSSPPLLRFDYLTIILPEYPSSRGRTKEIFILRCLISGTPAEPDSKQALLQWSGAVPPHRRTSSICLPTVQGKSYLFCEWPATDFEASDSITYEIYHLHPRKVGRSPNRFTGSAPWTTSWTAQSMTSESVRIGTFRNRNQRTE